mgnify:CR=1 FL=1
MTAQDIRSAYLKFMTDRGHTLIPRSNLVPQEDATTLFTGSGMQPMLTYLLGADHPKGVRLTDSQTVLRADDIDEVGDNRHTTFFEMLGNWSLGDYFKREQLPWCFEFLTDVIGLDPQRLYVTAFMGDAKSNLPRDEEVAEIWQTLFSGKGIEAKTGVVGSEEHGYRRGIKPGERIFFYDGNKNWWSRGGGPDTTPVGDPCGPDSEVFYRFGALDDLSHTAEQTEQYGENCHPNCDCGRFLEICNSVFMQYVKRADGSFGRLPRPNVDFGGGLERMAAASIGQADVFKISVIWPIIEQLEELSDTHYDQASAAMRVIADHLRAAVWLAVDGVTPSNTQQGYVLRRLVRRAIRQALALDLREDFLESLVPTIIELYADDFPEVAERQAAVLETLVREEHQFRKTLRAGVREFKKLAGEELTGQTVFMLFDTYGFPPELSLEEAHDHQVPVATTWRADFDRLLADQKDRSRTATAGQFKGGLADHSEISVQYHTATHLMYRALRLVLGQHVIQRGSNITPERLRFDFSHPDKMTPEQITEVERLVNEQIDKDWPLSFREEATKAALDSGVMGAFGDRYGDVVKVYTVGEPDGLHYSREICGGPHVDHTAQLAEGGRRFKITKEESSSAGIRRIKAVLS